LNIRFFDEENDLSFITEIETDIVPKETEQIVVDNKWYIVTNITKIYDNSDSYIDISLNVI